MSFIALTSLSQQARGESVVGSIDTKVSYTAAGKTTVFITQENTLTNALAREGIKLEKNDITDPPLITPLIGGEVTAKLIPAVSVLINDNGQSWVGKSAYNDTFDILNQLEVKIDKADKVSKEIILDPVMENMAGQKIEIRRAPVYTVSVDEKEVIVHSWSKTVAEVIGEGGVVLNQHDTVDPALSESAPTSGQIIVTCINYADIEEIVVVPFETIYKIDPTVGISGQRVDQEGVNGKITKKYHIVYHNGVAVSRVLMSQNTQIQVQNKVVSKGAEIGRANFGYYSGMVTSYYKGMTGRHLLVTNLDNGMQVTVRIIGSGPFNGPLMDMGTEPFQAIGGKLSSGYLPRVAVQFID